MKSISFVEGVVVALVLAAIASVVFAIASLLLGNAIGIRLVISLVSAAYGGYLLIRSTEKTGRLITVLVWSLVVALAWLAAPGVVAFMALHLGVMWLIRALYLLVSPIDVLLDYFLHGVALTAACWAALQTGTVFAAVWTFFLILAVFVWLPRFSATKERAVDIERNPNQAFADAFATAREAAEKLAKA